MHLRLPDSEDRSTGRLPVRRCLQLRRAVQLQTVVEKEKHMHRRTRVWFVYQDGTGSAVARRAMAFSIPRKTRAWAGTSAYQ